MLAAGAKALLSVLIVALQTVGLLTLKTQLSVNSLLNDLRQYRIFSEHSESSSGFPLHDPSAL
jgi:hypothetical protein